MLQFDKLLSTEELGIKVLSHQHKSGGWYKQADTVFSFKKYICSHNVDVLDVHNTVIQKRKDEDFKPARLSVSPSCSSTTLRKQLSMLRPQTPHLSNKATR